MPVAVIIQDAARPDFGRLPKSVRIAFLDVFDQLSQHGLRPGPGYTTHQLRGTRTLWTVAIPPYRGLLRSDGGRLVFLAFGKRAGFYKVLERVRL